MRKLKSWWLLSGKKITYYYSAAVLFATSIWLLAVAQNYFFIFIGLILSILSLRILVLGVNIAEPTSNQAQPSTIKEFVNRVIRIHSGTYNESLNVAGNYTQGNNIQGDSVQGDKNIYNIFNLHQNPSEAVDEINNYLRRLEKQFGSTEIALQKIIDDLAILAYSSSDVKGKLYSWLDSLGETAILDEIDAAEKFLGFVSNTHNHSVEQLFFGLNKKYQRLKYLLKTAQWSKADDETIRVIKKLMPSKTSKHNCTKIDISEISPRELNTINQLWLEASGGRFGFSVQQQIWRSILQSKGKQFPYNFARTEYIQFIKEVGWSHEQDRVYHVDFDYLITNPKGHLPAKILLWETYNPNSNYCYFSACLFDDLMARNYSNFSLLPAWLRKYLLIP